MRITIPADTMRTIAELAVYGLGTGSADEDRHTMSESLVAFQAAVIQAQPDGETVSLDLPRGQLADIAQLAAWGNI